jgi:hypothetical protein
LALAADGAAGGGETGSAPRSSAKLSRTLWQLDAAAHGIGVTKLALHEPPFVVDASRLPLPEDYVKRLTGLLEAGRRGDAVVSLALSRRLLPGWR